MRQSGGALAGDSAFHFETLDAATAGCQSVVGSRGWRRFVVSLGVARSTIKNMILL
jgi:hypothetical protein